MSNHDIDRLSNFQLFNSAWVLWDIDLTSHFPLLRDMLYLCCLENIWLLACITN